MPVGIIDKAAQQQQEQAAQQGQQQQQQQTQTQQPKPESSPQQPKDEFDAYLDRIKQSKQYFREAGTDGNASSGQNTTMNTEATGGYLDKEQLDTVKENLALSRSLAPAIVTAVDMGFTGLNTIIATKRQEGATEQEKKDLADLWAWYLKDKNLDLSPGAMLLVCTLLVYGPKTYEAVQCRMHEKELAEARRKEEAQRKRIAELEAKVKELEGEKAKDKENEKKEKKK